ncbi:MAG: hypothetical protein QG591_1391 [Planctomycetota bacterium]|nr:hypothetical protein [Planctomycetota bacterium]
MLTYTHNRIHLYSGGFAPRNPLLLPFQLRFAGSFCFVRTANWGGLRRIANQLRSLFYSLQLSGSWRQQMHLMSPVILSLWVLSLRPLLRSMENKSWGCGNRCNRAMSLIFVPIFYAKTNLPFGSGMRRPNSFVVSIHA